MKVSIDYVAHENEVKGDLECAASWVEKNAEELLAVKNDEEADVFGSNLKAVAARLRKYSKHVNRAV